MSILSILIFIAGFVAGFLFSAFLNRKRDKAVGFKWTIDPPTPKGPLQPKD